MSDQSHLTIGDGEEPGLLVLSGELDSHSCRALADKLDAAPMAEPIVLDMQAVRFVDSSGLRALLLAHEARGQSGSLIIRDPSRAVWRLLEITALTEYLTIEGRPPSSA